jgi:hypothetical protein
MKILKSISKIVVIAAISAVAFNMLMPLIAHAGNSLGNPGGGPNTGTIEQNSDLRQTILTVLNWGLGFLGLLATGFVIYGGFLYITNAEDTEKPKKIIFGAVVGIIIILVSFAIVNTVLDATSGQAA